MAIPAVEIQKDDQYVLNHCTRFLARDGEEARHDFGQYEPGDPRARVCEAWRYPVVDSYFDGTSVEASYPFNAVTFVYDGRSAPARRPTSPSSARSPSCTRPSRCARSRFLGEPSGVWAVTVRVPKGQVHTYKLRVDGAWLVDPLNPQVVELDNGRPWSRFFTEGCQIPLTFGRRERELLGRLASHLLPFRLPENATFIRGVYESLDRASREQQFPLAYRLDEEVGVVNYIDKVLARAERHYLDDYRTCLELIDGAAARALPRPRAEHAAARRDRRPLRRDGDRPGGRLGHGPLRKPALLPAAAAPPRDDRRLRAPAPRRQLRHRRLGLPAGPLPVRSGRRAIEAPLGASTDYRG